MLEKEIHKYVAEIQSKLSTTPPKVLYHYTDSLALKAIVENRNLRLSDVFSMNDPSEIRHGVNVAREQLESVFKDGIVSRIIKEEDKEKAIAVTKMLSRSAIEQIKITANYFIGCFSQIGDDLGQWRAYAADGHGYAMGFDGATFDAFFFQEDKERNQSFYINYDEKDLQAWHKGLTEILLRYLLAKTPAMHLEPHNFFAYIMGVLILSLIHKHPSYRSEQEYRFLQIFASDKLVPDIKHRTRQNKKGHYSLVGYREFSWAKLNPCPLKEIIVGPAADFESAKTFAEDCLRLYNFDLSKIEIKRSEIPYRS